MVFSNLLLRGAISSIFLVLPHAAASWGWVRPLAMMPLALMGLRSSFEVWSGRVTPVTRQGGCMTRSRHACM